MGSGNRELQTVKQPADAIADVAYSVIQQAIRDVKQPKTASGVKARVRCSAITFFENRDYNEWPGFMGWAAHAHVGEIAMDLIRTAMLEEAKAGDEEWEKKMAEKKKRKIME